MAHRHFKSILATLFIVVFAAACAFPLVALAAQSNVRVENHTAPNTDAVQVSELEIDGVGAPRPGEPLDDRATVTSAEGETWDIPVLWIGSDWQLATEAAEGQTYMPALAFYLPAGYAIQDADNAGGYTVAFSDSLAKLFGEDDVVSVYDSSTGITYILPAMFRDFFAKAPNEPLGIGDGTNLNPNYAGTANQAPAENPEADSDTDTDFDSDSNLTRWVDIYCAQTAKDALSQEDLEYLVDLIINKLQPQAVNLLLKSFPAFHTAAGTGQISMQIGLYIYCEAGDEDGDPAHEDAKGGLLAYVAGRHYTIGEDVHYAYLLAVDASSIAQRDDSGRLVLVREGENAVTFENTIVHEILHAIMDDYNRVGMTGVSSVDCSYIGLDPDELDENQLAEYNRTLYPSWFREGIASAVENVYQYRYDYFALLRSDPDSDGTSALLDAYTQDGVFQNFVQGTENGTPVAYGLMFADGAQDAEGHELSTTPSRYVSGYLAVLYLGELAARNDPAIGSSVSTESGTTTVSSSNIRLGLNSILERLHNGETLDQVIYDISPVDDNGSKRYRNTDDFENAFIFGQEGTQEGTYYGDFGEGASVEFETTFLNYMRGLEKETDRQYKPNGSVLFDFDEDFETPLDRTKQDNTFGTLRIAESNTYVDSTVPDSLALSSGGKSESGSGAQDEQAANNSDELLLAAKAQDEPLEAAPEPETETVEQEAPTIDTAQSLTDEPAIGTPTDEPTVEAPTMESSEPPAGA